MRIEVTARYDLKSEPRRVISQAINAAVAEGKRQTLKYGKSRLGIAQQSLRKRVFTQKATVRNLYGRLWVGGFGFSSGSWPAGAKRQLKKGVRIKMGVLGEQFFPKAFIIRKNGKSIVLQRKDGKLRDVFFHEGPGLADAIAPVRMAIYGQMKRKSQLKLRNIRIKAVKL